MRSWIWLLGLSAPVLAWGQEGEDAPTQTAPEDSGAEAPAAEDSEDAASQPAPPSDTASPVSEDVSSETPTNTEGEGPPLAVPVQPAPSRAADTPAPSSPATKPAAKPAVTPEAAAAGERFEPEPPIEDASKAQLRLPEGWDWEPYWRPIFSLTGVGNAYVYRWPMTLGAQGGVRMWDTESPLQINARAQATTTFGAGAIGSDLRVGTFIGPGWEFFNVMVGPDIFRNTYRINNYPSAGYALEPSFGVDLRTLVTVGPEDFYAMAGVTPSLLLNPDRRVDWDEVGLIGIGHEFEWVVGLISNTGPFRLGLVYSRRVLANGVQQGWGVSAGI
ncbi:MAG: hypothetical protein H6741_03100 [Alphaproteobacteria bacterium]|nr:hypothetical protein [Alphaproteobacteria bacterium]